MSIDENISDLQRAGRQALESGNVNLALNHLCKVARSAPSVQVWLDLAEAYQKLGRGNIYMVYLSKAMSELSSPPDAMREKLAQCVQGFLDSNPNVRDVQRLYVKNPSAPRVKQERAEFFKALDRGNSAAAFKLGLKQYKQRRVDPLIQGIWCSIASRNGEPQMGLNAAFAAFVREPHDWITLTNIGDILGQLRKTGPALDFCLAAVNLKPDLAVAWINLAAAFENQGSHWEASKACREAIKLNPADGMAWTNLGNSLKNSGRAAEAVDAFREAVKLQPDNTALWSNLLFGILYDENATPEDIAHETFRFGEYWEPKIKPNDHKARLKIGVPNKLKVGFVSADIKSHPVAYFFEPLLENLDREKFEIFIYYNNLQEDAVTKRFKALADKWVDISGLKDPEFVKLVQCDKIEVLVDMSGHTARNRLLAFAHKPAPVQVTWLGHPASTGLSRMDWRITDFQSDPSGAEQFYSEKLYRFDCSICYAPLIKDPMLRSDPRFQVNPTPALINGYVTFGSCNNLAKINAEVVGVWSKILHSVEGSKILIESPGLSQSEFRIKVQKDFREHGILEDRLILYNRDSSLQYIRYHEIDIALDPFPYGGGTTSVDLLWMGVPLVSLVRPTVMGRSGKNILSALGAPEWVADTPEQYIQLAAGLAANITHLNDTRYRLRSKLEASILMDGPSFGEKFGRALEAMYAQACAGV